MNAAKPYAKAVHRPQDIGISIAWAIRAPLKLRASANAPLAVLGKGAAYGPADEGEVETSCTR